jgi:hypothetical protein
MQQQEQNGQDTIMNFATTIAQIQQNNNHRPTSGPDQYEAAVYPDQHKTKVLKYIPGIGKSIYTYQRKLEESFIRNNITDDYTKITVLKDRLQIRERTNLDTWCSNQQEYQEVVDYISKNIDRTYPEDQLQLIRENPQKPNEHIQDFYIRHEDDFEVYKKIIEREEGRQVTETEFLRQFASHCQTAEKETIMKKIETNKIKTKEELRRHISSESVEYTRKLRMRKEGQNSGSMTPQEIQRMCASVVRREMEDMNSLERIRREELKGKQTEDIERLNNIGSQSSNSNFGKEVGRPQVENKDNYNRHIARDRSPSPRNDNRDSRHSYDNRSPSPRNDNRDSRHSYGNRPPSPRNDIRDNRDNRYNNNSRSPYRRYDNNNRGGYESRPSPRYDNRENRYNYGNRSPSPRRDFRDDNRPRNHTYDRNRSPSPRRDSREEYRTRSPMRSRSPSPDVHGCYMCEGQHRGLECPFVSEWLKETFLWNFLEKKERRGERVSMEQERKMREEYKITEEGCKNNPARLHKQNNRVPGEGPYCKYCNTREHPTLFCNQHCSLCQKTNVGHGWRTCPSEEHKQKKYEKDSQIKKHLEKTYRRWKGVDLPKL